MSKTVEVLVRIVFIPRILDEEIMEMRCGAKNIKGGRNNEIVKGQEPKNDISKIYEKRVEKMRWT